MVTNAGSTGQACTPSQLGPVNPCSGLSFIVNTQLPAGYVIIAKYEWFVNGTSVKTTTDPSDPILQWIIVSDPTNVFCKVTYKKQDGTLSTSYTSTTFTPDIKGLNFGDITTSTPSPNYGCTNPFSYSLNTFTCTNFCDHIYSVGQYNITWQAPTGWLQTSISTNGNDVTLTPDATSGGTLIATIHLPCGFTATKTFNINRVTPAPTFTTTNVRTCSTSADMSINPICGASNYTYTIIGNAGVTFTANGQQTLTTTGTTVNVSITGGSSANTIKVKVNYPNNISSAQVSTTLTAGAPTQQTRSSNTFTTNGYAAALQDCNVVTGLESTGYFNGYIDRTDEVATSFTWSLQSKSSNAAVTISPNPDYQHAVISIKPQGASAHYKLTVSNSCGYYITYHSFMANTPCPIVVESLPAASSDFSIAPNPAQDYVSISSTTQSKTANSRNLIYGVKIADQRGILQKTYEFKSGVPSTKVSINGLNPGLYLISIFNGQAWKSKQLIVK